MKRGPYRNVTRPSKKQVAANFAAFSPLDKPAKLDTRKRPVLKLKRDGIGGTDRT